MVVLTLGRRKLNPPAFPKWGRGLLNQGDDGNMYSRFGYFQAEHLQQCEINSVQRLGALFWTELVRFPTREPKTFCENNN